jgi:hypothetical protein
MAWIETQFPQVWVLGRCCRLDNPRRAWVSESSPGFKKHRRCMKALQKQQFDIIDRGKAECLRSKGYQHRRVCSVHPAKKQQWFAVTVTAQAPRATQKVMKCHETRKLLALQWLGDLSDCQTWVPKRDFYFGFSKVSPVINLLWRCPHSLAGFSY